METALSTGAKVYLVALGMAALALAAYLFSNAVWADQNWLAALLFLVLVFISSSFPVKLPSGVVMSVSFTIIFASILLFKPFVVVLISVLGDLLSLRKGRSPVQYYFNAVQFTISTAIASLVFQLFHPNGLQFSIFYIMAALVPLLICFLLNLFFITVIIALAGGGRLSSVWVNSIKWSVPNYIGMASLGLVIALTFQNIGIWGLVLFIIPMIIARQSLNSYMDMRQTFLDTIQSLSATLDAKDPYTRGHSTRVATFATALARELGWSTRKTELLQYVAMVHDVGKVAIPESILKKEGKLTAGEYARMKEHSLIGFNIIKDIRFLASGADIIKHHHEWWDGTGYPDGLRGEGIPEGARILAVADAFDAMISDRSYRKAPGLIRAVQEIKEGAGTQFDPFMADTFIRIIPRLNLEGEAENAVETRTGGTIVAEIK